MREHRFSIGQSVRMPNRLGTLKTDDLLFTVTGTDAGERQVAAIPHSQR